MSFSNGDDLSVDVDFVRFHTGDVVEGQNFLSDEIIASLVDTTGSKQAAVIAGLKHIIMRLSQPNFTADWLKVENQQAREGYENMLAEKKKEFGIGTLVATSGHVYRADSAETGEPDFSAGRPSLYGDDYDDL